jgi:hypothetical protein
VLNFEQERGPGKLWGVGLLGPMVAAAGGRWPPLAERTQKERARGIDKRGIPFHVGAKHPILVRTGDLKRSFTDPRHPRHITEVGRDAASTWISVSAEENPQTPNRIQTLHFGGFTEEGNPVPPRPFVGLGPQARAWVLGQAENIVRQRAERAVKG